MVHQNKILVSVEYNFYYFRRNNNDSCENIYKLIERLYVRENQLHQSPTTTEKK